MKSANLKGLFISHCNSSTRFIDADGSFAAGENIQGRVGESADDGDLTSPGYKPASISWI